MCNQKSQNIENLYLKFNKGKKDETYKILDIQNVDGFRIVTFQVNMQKEERTMLNQRLAQKAFMN